jgi:hypothetical protein
VVPPSTQPSASSVPDLQLSPVAFTCKLPVITTSGGGDYVVFAGGFLTFPAGTYQADPNGVIRSRYPQGDFATDAQPVLYGGPQVGPPFYDLAMKRWLPVGSGQTSPDGSSYAYSVPGPSNSDPTKIHVVTVSTGADHVLTIEPPPQDEAVGWQVADYDGKSVFLVGQQVDQSPGGVWRLTVATGSLNLLTQARHIQLVQNGIAWIALNNPADPSPPVAPKGAAFDSIATVDLSTGAQTTWVYKPGEAVGVLAVEESLGLVASIVPNLEVPAWTVVAVASPGAAGNVISSSGQLGYAVQPDRSRLWFGNNRGIYLWTQATGFIKVYAYHGDPIQAQAIEPAGRCV